MTQTEATDTGEELMGAAETKEVSPLAKGEAMALWAVSDRVRHIRQLGITNQELREIGAPDIPSAEETLAAVLDELEQLTSNVDNAADLAASGRPLPEISEQRTTIDLKYKIYKKDGSISERK